MTTCLGFLQRKEGEEAGRFVEREVLQKIGSLKGRVYNEGGSPMAL